MAETKAARRPKLHGEGLQALAECRIGDCPWQHQEDEVEDVMKAWWEHADRDHARLPC